MPKVSQSLWLSLIISFPSSPNRPAPLGHEATVLPEGQQPRAVPPPTWHRVLSGHSGPHPAWLFPCPLKSPSPLWGPTPCLPSKPQGALSYEYIKHKRALSILQQKAAAVTASRAGEGGRQFFDSQRKLRNSPGLQLGSGQSWPSLLPPPPTPFLLPSGRLGCGSCLFFTGGGEVEDTRQYRNAP